MREEPEDAPSAHFNQALLRRVMRFARPYRGQFALSVLLFSQAATVTTLMPVAVALGIAGGDIIAMFPAVNGYFFLPTYGTLLAAISFDRTGTTRIGKYVLNHSFMLPGLVSTVCAIAIGFVLARIV